MRILRPGLLATVASVLTLLALPALASAATGKPVDETATSGQVTAHFTYTTSSDGFQNTGLHLTVARAGVTAYDAPVKVRGCDEPYCATFQSISGGDAKSLAVLDFDKDGEPDVMVTVFTGGSHCCTISQLFSWNGTAYGAVTHNWGDGAYVLKDRDGDGRIDFTTDDDSFAYLYASYAESLRPMLVLDYDHGKWIDITDRLKPSLTLEASRAFRISRRACAAKGSTLGAYAAWAADKYRLGQRTAALRQLRVEQKRGCLIANGAGFPAAKNYITSLDRFLRASPYYR